MRRQFNVLRVHTEADHPLPWAQTQENLAILYQSWINHDTCINPREHLDSALEHINSALTVYEPEHSDYDFESASQLRDEILAALKTIDDTEED